MILGLNIIWLFDAWGSNYFNSLNGNIREIISFLSPNLSIYALSGKAKTTEFQSKLNSLETERKETKETTLVLKYNQAVVLFHQQQFQKSIDILNELKKKIREEPVRLNSYLSVLHRF